MLASHTSLLCADSGWKQLVSHVIYIFARPDTICKAISKVHQVFFTTISSMLINLFVLQWKFFLLFSFHSLFLIHILKMHIENSDGSQAYDVCALGLVLCIVFSDRHLLQSVWNERPLSEKCDRKILSHACATVTLAEDHPLTTPRDGTTKIRIVQNHRSKMLYLFLHMCTCWQRYAQVTEELFPIHGTRLNGIKIIHYLK